MRITARSPSRLRYLATAATLSLGLLTLPASAIEIDITSASFNFTGSAIVPFDDDWTPIAADVLLTESDTERSFIDIQSSFSAINGTDPLDFFTPLNSFTIDSSVAITLFPVLEFSTTVVGGFGGGAGDTISLDAQLTGSSVDIIEISLTNTPLDGLSLLEVFGVIANGDPLGIPEANLTVTNVSMQSDALGFEKKLGISIGGDAAFLDVITASIDGFTLDGVPLTADLLLNTPLSEAGLPGVLEVVVTGSIADAAVDPPFGPFTLRSTTIPPVATPEPGSLALLGGALALGAIPALRRRRRGAP